MSWKRKLLIGVCFSAFLCDVFLASFNWHMMAPDSVVSFNILTAIVMLGCCAYNLFRKV
jgi:hypothetical protein